MKSFLFGVLVIGLLSLASLAEAHGGRTNAMGCHTNHSTGDYHCHGSKKPAPSQATYCHVVNGERRCGYAYSSCQNLVSKFGGYCVSNNATTTSLNPVNQPSIEHLASIGIHQNISR